MTVWDESEATPLETLVAVAGGVLVCAVAFLALGAGLAFDALRTKVGWR